LKNDFWSVAAVTIALFTFLYCLSFIVEVVFNSPAADLLASLRTLPKGEM